VARDQVPVLGAVLNMAGLVSPDGTLLHPFGEVDGEAGIGADILAELPLEPAVVAASDRGVPLETGAVASGLDRVAAQVAEALKL